MITQKRGSADSANPAISEKVFVRCLVLGKPDEGCALNTGLIKLMTRGKN